MLTYTNMKYNLIRLNVNSHTLWNCIVILFAVGFTRFPFDFRFPFRYSSFPLNHNGTGFRAALATREGHRRMDQCTYDVIWSRVFSDTRDALRRHDHIVTAVCPATVTSSRIHHHHHDASRVTSSPLISTRS